MSTTSMDNSEYQSSSSSSSSSSPMQITTLPIILCQPKHKKKAGRKVFKETRHPVYRGVRRKNGGKWVCEVREPNKQSRIWLGTFPDPETAAVAHDVAALALRGDHAPLNFPDSVGRLPRARSSSHRDIQKAAFQAARDLSPSFRVLQENNDQAQNLSDSSMENYNVEKNDFAMDKPPCVVVGFVDEEEVFNMPVLLDSMAEGMLLTPLAMKKGFNWSQYQEVDDEDDGLEFNLWGY